MYEEIKNYIIDKGIGEYLYEMGVDFNNKEQSYDLINLKFKQNGFFFNFKLNPIDIYQREYSKALENTENFGFFNGVLLCLANVDQLKFQFCNRQELLNIIDKDSKFTKYFFDIIQDMWYLNDETKENLLYDIFITEIKDKSKSNDILYNIYKLIEFLLLNIHNEIKVDKNGKKIRNNSIKLDEMFKNYNEINNNFYPVNNSIIKDLFFFEIEANYYCFHCKKYDKQYFIYWSLYFDINQIEDNLKKYEIVHIGNILFKLEKQITCFHCKKKYISKIRFNSCPQFLIINIKPKENFKFKFKINETIDIYKYMTVNNHSNHIYELICLIRNQSITFCKSSVNYQWYRYEGINVNIVKNINNNIEDNIPYLLIYKIQDNKYNNNQ